jgi:hypothetical protein
LQREFLLGAIGSIRQGLQQLQPFGEVTDRLNVRRALHSSVACLLPVGKGLRDQAGFGVMMCHELWLGRDGLRKLLR